ncbi:hypothetical protein OG439_19100 [Amycolatopsis sp. NBC_01307]|uniref:hypothetical protein n=1 Tax=Amycolatopsis sp. NBC_01307 TaxID=2903561 RepID=UPI002E0F1579|nr:hypothetical protein OG439_19100 [Amycolatopsis sp. NBC_01307]
MGTRVRRSGHLAAVGADEGRGQARRRSPVVDGDHLEPGIGLGGLVGGALLAGFGPESLIIAAVVLLVPTALAVLLARTHAFPARNPVSGQ